MRRKMLLAAMTLASVLALTTLAGCSREKIDWKSAEAADTVEGYDHFIERHPDSALAAQARTRVAQLNEDRDWKKATAADTADAYREFLAQHESGKWAEEARIRVENFALDGTASGPPKPAADAEPAVAATAPTVASPMTPAAATPLPAHGPKEAQTPAAATASSAAAAKPASTTAPSAAPAKPATAPTAAPAKPAPANVEPKRVAAATTAAPPSRPATEGSSTAAPKSTAPPQFGIQLGAFRTQDAALKNWKQLQLKYDADLHGLFAHAVPVKQTSGQLFRLQAPVGLETRARAICASLAKQSQPCVVVLPEP